MKVKKESCKYCRQKMEAKTTRAEFCSGKCRVYWNRENPRVSLKNFNSGNRTIKPIKETPQKSNYTISKDEILKQIANIRAEKIPDGRNTIMGRKSWNFEQSEKIKSLQKQLF